MGCDERSRVHPYLIEPWHPYLIRALARAPPGVWRPDHGRAGGRVPAVPRERFVSEDGVVNDRACVLGGGSCLNAGFCTRASSGYVCATGWTTAKFESIDDW
jgi:hypothetical protein